MKTLLLKKQELDKLPVETQNQILNIIKERKITIQSLKNRIQTLSVAYISYREDTNRIVLQENSKNLLVNVYEKTAGEEWENCAGSEYVFRLGMKYIRVDREHYRTNSLNWSASFYISAEKLSEILDLFEEAEQEKDEIDADKIYKIAAQRVDALYNIY